MLKRGKGHEAPLVKNKNHAQAEATIPRENDAREKGREKAKKIQSVQPSMERKEKQRTENGVTLNVGGGMWQN